VEVFAADFTDGITEGFEPRSPYNDVTNSPSKLPMESSTDSFCRWFHQQKWIYHHSADHFLPNFSFFPIPTEWEWVRLSSSILLMESPRDSNRDLCTMTWPILHQNCRWNHRQNEYITTLPTISSLISPSFLSQLSHPKLQTTTP
jgi:hypothetical protein